MDSSPAGPNQNQKTAAFDTPFAFGRFLVGAALLAASSGAAGVLSYQQITRAWVPGCGPGSGCSQLAASAWGKVPVIDWPVSFLGFAYFLAVLVAWISVRGRFGAAGSPMRWLIRLGALASLVFMGVMYTKGLFCMYCFNAHMGNLLFVALVEATGRSAGALRVPRWRGIVAVAAMFAASTIAIGAANQHVAKAAEEQHEAELDESLQEMLRALQQQSGSTPAPAPQPPVTADPESSPTPSGAGHPMLDTLAMMTSVLALAAWTETEEAQPAAAPPSAAPAAAPVFTGRYRWGPERAGIRIVMFTGYQCIDCRNMDRQVKEVLSRWPDIVSFSVKHFPMSNLCNPHMPTNMHPNACWAARAAEAAGLLAGREGFVRMHNWLYEQGGSFTDTSLPASLTQLGFDPTTFIPVMTGPETLRRVQADIEEGMKYGLSQTPMIFINGIELKGWQAANALVRAVEVLAASKPEPKGPEGDRPPLAAEKAMADWRAAPNQAWPSRPRSWGLGPEGATVRVQVFGDLQEPNTAEVDRTIRNAMAGRDDIRYEFRYFPADQSCNKHVQVSPYPLGCRAAKAAEAAGILGGHEVYWRMHEWLMNNQQRFTDDNLRAFVQTLGLDPGVFMITMDTPEVAQAIETDSSLGSRLGMQAIPRIFVNGKVVARWNLPGEFIIERVIEEAASGR